MTSKSATRVEHQPVNVNHTVWSICFKYTSFEASNFKQRLSYIVYILGHWLSYNTRFFCLNPMCVFSPWRRIPPPNRTKKKSNVTGRFPRLTRLPVSEVELPELHGSWLWQLWMIFVVQNKELRWWRLWKREIRWYYPEGDSDIPEPRGMFEGNFHLFPVWWDMSLTWRILEVWL